VSDDATISTKIALARVDERLKALEEEALAKLGADLRVAVTDIRSQLKIIWALVFLVISGLVSVAFSMWQGGIP